MKNKISKNLYILCLGILVEILMAYTNTFQTYYLTYILAGITYLIIGIQFQKFMLSKSDSFVFLIPLFVIKIFLISVNNYNFPFIFPFCFTVSIFAFVIGYYLKIYSKAFFLLNFINCICIYYIGFIQSPQIVEERYRKRVSINETKILKSWNLINLDGSVLPFETIKGKVALLNFSWKNCGQCVIKQPYLTKLQEKYKDNSDFIILEIDLGEYDTIADARIFSKQHQNDLKWAYDTNNQLAQKLGYSGAPHQVIIDKNSKIRQISSGFNGDLGIIYIEKTSKEIDALLHEEMQ